MNQITAQTHISGGQGGKSHMKNRYMANVAGKDRTARINLTYGI